MGTLQFFCPATHQQASTGIENDVDTDRTLCGRPSAGRIGTLYGGRGLSGCEGVAFPSSPLKRDPRDTGRAASGGPRSSMRRAGGTCAHSLLSEQNCARYNDTRHERDHAVKQQQILEKSNHHSLPRDWCFPRQVSELGTFPGDAPSPSAPPLTSGSEPRKPGT